MVVVHCRRPLERNWLSSRLARVPTRDTGHQPLQAMSALRLKCTIASLRGQATFEYRSNNCIHSRWYIGDKVRGPNKVVGDEDTENYSYVCSEEGNGRGRGK